MKQVAKQSEDSPMTRKAPFCYTSEFPLSFSPLGHVVQWLKCLFRQPKGNKFVQLVNKKASVSWDGFHKNKQTWLSSLVLSKAITSAYLLTVTNTNRAQLTLRN